MKINRHNYEEFFLLYVDNELSAADRKAVEVFVQENPDLEGELQMLLQTVAGPEGIILEKKDWLFMEETVPALQENLLLYADDELSGPDKRTIEALLATDKAAQAEWNILRQTKLQPDTSVVFTDKQSLYRTEGARLVSFRWWRVAAAAVLLGIVLWTGVTVYNNNLKAPRGTEGIANNDPGKEQPANKAGSNTKIAENGRAGTIVPQNTTASADKNDANSQPAVNYKQPAQKTGKQNAAEQKDNIAVQDNNTKPTNNLPKPYFENINNSTSNETARNNVTPEKDNSGNNINTLKTNPIEKTNDPAVSALTGADTDPATIAAIPVVNKNPDENNRYLDIDESKGRRTLFGGIIRKAKRVLERTANIKTGEGLKVAGFEIALK